MLKALQVGLAEKGWGDRVVFPPNAHAGEVKVNLSVHQLVEEAIKNGEGILTDNGSLRVATGKHTGRSPKDKFIVDSPSTHDGADKICNSDYRGADRTRANLYKYDGSN